MIVFDYINIKHSMHIILFIFKQDLTTIKTQQKCLFIVLALQKYPFFQEKSSRDKNKEINSANNQ